MNELEKESLLSLLNNLKDKILNVDKRLTEELQDIAKCFKVIEDLIKIQNLAIESLDDKINLITKS